MKVGRAAETRPPRALRGAGLTVLLLAAFVVGTITGDVGWHDLVLGRLRRVASRIVTSTGREQLPVLAVDMAFADYRGLLAQREAALRDGVHLDDAAGFLPAAIRVGDETAAVELQLREGPANDLGVDDKWPLVARVAEDVPLTTLPFNQFILQDPGENNWLMQWAFSEALRAEGFATPRCTFVRLVLNGDDRGIYAVQEGLGDSFMVAHNLLPGAIVGYDTSPLWRATAHFGGNQEAALADPVGNLSSYDLSSFVIETLHTSTLAGPEIEAQEDRALDALHALQTGRRSPSEVFDREQYGLLLALVDLWDATEALSLVNLRYVYDDASGTLHPIVTDANPLASGGRLALTATYGDPLLQMAYVQAADRLTQPSYIDGLEERLMANWLRLAAAMADELPDSEPPWQQLEQRQKVLQRSLNPIQPVLAYVLPSVAPDYQLLNIEVANRLNLPIEVLGFDIGGATFVAANATQVATSDEVLPGLGEGVAIRAAGQGDSGVVHYTRFALRLDVIQQVDSEAVFDERLAIRVAVRLLGSTNSKLVRASRDLPQPFVSQEAP